MAACSAKDRFFFKLGPRPHFRQVIFDLGVAIEAWIPAAAAFELDRYDVERRVPVRASGFPVDVDPKHFTAVNNSHE